MTESMRIEDLAFYRRDDVPAGIAWWATAEEDHPINIVLEPAADVDDATQVQVAHVIRRLPKFLAEARAWLTTELAKPEWDFSESELLALESDPFQEPEIIVWGPVEWMIRFEAPTLEMADPWGIAVVFQNDTPIAVEDLSEGDDDEDDDEEE